MLAPLCRGADDDPPIDLDRERLAGGADEAMTRDV
jgi:hypothetical protein